MGGRPEGFGWQERPDGSIRITHHGKPAPTSGANELVAKNHPRNR